MQNSERKCVLAVRFGAFGDVAASIPVVYSACRCHPGTHFVMVTAEAVVPLFVNRPDNLTVEGVATPDMHHAPSRQWGLGASLQKTYSPDTLIDLHGDASTRMLRLYCRLHGIRTARAAADGARRRALVRHANKVMLPLPSVRARYREAFFRGGLPVESAFEGIYGRGGRGDVSLIAPVTGGPKPVGHRWIGIAPFAAYPTKEYPTAMMQEVIEGLLDGDDCTIYIFGGRGREKETAQAIAAAHAPRVTAVAGIEHGLDAELSLLSHLDVLLTMDSANMHLAALTCTPTVSIWGATHYYCGYIGWGQNDDDLVQIPLSCRPCSISGEKECSRHDLLCLTAIRPETVLRKIRQTMEGSKV